MSLHYDYLEKIFPAQAVILATEAGRTLAMARQTVKNKIRQGKFPIPTTLVGGHRVVLKFDLAHYLDSLGQSRPRRGRPPKVAPEMEVIDRG